MRHIIWVICLLCTSLITRGQTNYEYVYWFDGDYASRKMASSDTTKLTLQADVSELSETLHTLHLQVRSASGVWSSPLTRMFVNMRKTDTREGWYWFDDEDKAREKQNISGLFDVDVSMLDNGLHTIHYMAVDAKGNTASPVSRTFLKIAEKGEELTYRCWFDNKNDSIFTGTITDNLFWLDVSSLEDGLHTVHVQVLNHLESSPLTYQFLKTPQIIGVEYLTCLCYIDGKLYHQERVSSSDGVVNWNLDVGALKQGMHTIQVQIVTPSGVASSLCEGMFIRSTTGKEMASLKCFYTIDNAESRIEAGSYADGTFHFDLDVASLTDGLHQLTYMLLGDNGVSTKISSSFFVKTPVGGNGITQYLYWLNDDEAHKTVVELEKRTNPLQLIGLLPVESVPIRSSCFHFEVDEEKGPMLYAKNEFHIRFFDATGRLTDAAKPYLDYNVSEKVEDVKRLNNTQSVAKPSANEIKWYQFEALVGDSVAFKTDKACSVNVFNAAGDELYAVSGGDAVKYDGCVIREDGTYYVALHDVTATQGANVKLDFFHVGKYVVLEYSPKNVGVTPSVLCMDLFGNGYQHLQKAELQRGTTVLTSDSISTTERSKTQLRFILENGDYERGAYTLKLYFDDGEDSKLVTIEDAVAFEDPVWGNIEITFTDKRALALPYPVSINVSNTGNVAYSLVPLNFAYDTSERIENGEFLDFGISVPEELLEAGYSPITYTDNLFGKGVTGVVASTFISNLSPGETVSVTVGFSGRGHTKFKLSAWTGTPWSTMTNDAIAARENHAGTGNVANSTSCMPDPCDYLSPIYEHADAGNMMDCYCALSMATIKTFANSFLAILGKRNRTLNSIYADNTDFRYDEYVLESPGDIVWGIAEHCLGSLGERLGVLREILELQNEAAEVDCPNRQSRPVEILTPGDPNDIIGFKSVAGSKFVPTDIDDTHYTIRFENDPEIATTSAHVITVRDTLDGRYLDLSTFNPTSVCIGDRILELNGEKSFTKTLDMRTRVDAIAEVSLDYDEVQGIAVWTIRSLDPMTMEETWDYMQGVLPVNSNGEGEGQISFDIKLREGLSDGVEISNRASITFDYENAILTPTWTNIVDGVCPESTITEIAYKNDSIVTLNIEGNDERSGVWKYDLYVQSGEDSLWIKEGELAADSTLVEYPVRNGLYYGFCVLATDSAGNMEQKELRPEAMCPNVLLGDVNGDGLIMVNDVVITINVILGSTTENFIFAAADMNGDSRILVNDVVLMIQKILTNNVSSMSKTRKIDKDENMSLDCTEVGFTISVPNAALYTAMQFDLLLPEGTNVRDIRIKDNKSHNAIFYDKGNGKVRVAVMSMSNETFPSDNLLEVRLDAPGNAEIFINGAYMATHNGEICRLPNMSTLLHGQTTDINQTLTGDTMHDVYDLNGRLIRENATTTNELRTGVYVINGKKMIVK